VIGAVWVQNVGYWFGGRTDFAAKRLSLSDTSLQICNLCNEKVTFYGLDLARLSTEQFLEVAVIHREDTRVADQCAGIVSSVFSRGRQRPKQDPYYETTSTICGKDCPP